MTLIRDNRALSRLDPSLREADEALDEFGRVYLNDSPRPWSRSTMLGRVIEFGNQGAAQGSAPPTHLSPRVVIVDRRFVKFTPLCQRVLLTVYCWRRTECREQQAIRSRVPLRSFERELRQGREAVRDDLLAALPG